MAFKIKDFISSTQEGLAREAHFDLQIVIPELVRSKLSQDQSEQLLNILCTSATLPSRTIDIAAIRPTGTGLINYFATGANFSAMDTTFYCDVNSNIIKIFQAWMESMVDIRTVGNYNSIEYRDNYSTQIILNHYTPTSDSPRTKYIFEKAFPVSFGPLTFGWSSLNNLVLVPVSFVYVSYKIDETPSRSVTNLSTTNQIGLYNNLPVTGNTPLE
jgi:hypothetical protein